MTDRLANALIVVLAVLAVTLSAACSRLRARNARLEQQLIDVNHEWAQRTLRRMHAE